MSGIGVDVFLAVAPEGGVSGLKIKNSVSAVFVWTSSLAYSPKLWFTVS